VRIGQKDAKLEDHKKRRSRGGASLSRAAGSQETVGKLSRIREYSTTNLKLIIFWPIERVGGIGKGRGRVEGTPRGVQIRPGRGVFDKGGEEGRGKSRKRR